MEQDDIEKLLAIYRNEATECLDELGQIIEALRVERGSARAAAVKRGMHLTHNLKGASRGVGRDDVAQIAHQVEDSLSRLPDGPEGLAVLDGIVKDVVSMERLADGTSARDRAVTQRVVGLVEGGPRRGGEVSVRVEGERIDRLATFTRELLITHARQSERLDSTSALLEDLAAWMRERGVGEEPEARQLVRRLESRMQADRRDVLDFGNLTTELNQALKQVRLMRLSVAAPGWRRTIREAAQDLGKDVRLDVRVGDIEIDKAVLDRLYDPLYHLLRNSVGHGIETPEERRAVGKESEGTILVQAEVRGAHVKVAVCDDGRGIQVQSVAEAAVRSGILDQRAVADLSAEQTLDLIFAPGFSTARNVTELSGRGVGLDVVRRAVEDVGGSVRAIARGDLGGAAIVLDLPVSALSTHGLLVRAEATTYLIPLDAVDRVLQLELSAVTEADGMPVARCEDGEPLRLRWLASAMGGGREHDLGRAPVIVIARGQSRLGLVVEEVLHQGEFVTQRLPWNLPSVAGVNGVVMLADGELAAAVDVPFLFRIDRSAGFVEGQPLPRQRSAILVVDDSLATRTLHRNILESAGYEVAMAADGEQAWRLLRGRHFDAVVTDVLMPGMDGFDLTRRIRAHPRLRNLPVVLVTSLGHPEDLRRGAEVGANEYVVKGQYDHERLLKAVTSHV
jgi:two-component system chemotaxis sensor kinase CheA